MEILNLSPESRTAVASATAKALKKGKVVAAPTDTVYGLLALATNPDSVERVFEIKGRERGKALPLFVSGVVSAQEVAEVSREQREFLSRVWPGKMTCVLRAQQDMVKGTTQEGKVALRVPDHSFLLSVLRQVGKPVTATSANVAGEPTVSDSSRLEDIFDERKEKPDLLVSAGVIESSLPSTVVDLTQEPYRVIRQGAVVL